MKNKIRLDKYLFETGLCETTDIAQRKVMAGWVKVNGETVREPGRIISGSEYILAERPGGKYASRGGEKLGHALEYFDISVKGRITADLGSSTGGFTDCLLQNGAARVYSIDVGYGLLDQRLRNDPRVILKERTNVKKLSREDFPDKADFITIDLSFISILNVFKNIKKVFSPAEGIILIKPQFEAKKEEHEKGVVKNSDHHKNILKRVVESLILNGMIFMGIHFSPIKGPAGNIEFLLYFQVNEGIKSGSLPDIDLIIENVVREAHQILS